MIFGEDDPQPQQDPAKQRQVRLDASSMDTAYANSFALVSSAEEITLYLGTNSPMPGMKQPVVKVTHRFIMLPQNAKRLAIALQQTVKTYEDRFGPIELPPPPKGGPSG